MRKLLLSTAVALALCAPAYAQTTAGQVRTYMGPSLGEAWVLPSSNPAGTTGTGAAVFATSPTLVTPALGTPSAVVLTSGTGLPIATGVSGLGTGVADFLATPSSANLATAVTGETGSGALVFGTNPTVTTPHITTPLYAQGAPTAATTSATLTAAALLTKIITVNQGGAAASAQQLPLASDLDTALPTAITGDSFEFSVINISVVDAEDASVTTNTGWTLVGSMDILAYSAAGTASSARFRARKTGTATWTLYRVS